MTIKSPLTRHWWCWWR